MLVRYYSKTKFLLNLFFGAFIYLAAGQSLASQPKIGEWGTTISTFEIIENDIKDLKLDNTILEALVKGSGKGIDFYLSDDKRTLKLFKVTYRVPIKVKKGKSAKEEDVVQYGLFKALPQAMQQKLDDKPTQSLPIQYKTHHPLIIEFVVKDETFSSPALLTDKVELFGKSSKKKKKH